MRSESSRLRAIRARWASSEVGALAGIGATAGGVVAAGSVVQPLATAGSMTGFAVGLALDLTTKPPGTIEWE